MTRQSASSASSMPPATAGPSTAAITGLSNSIRLGPIGPRGAGAAPVGKASLRRISRSKSSRSASVEAYFRSQPPQNAPPAPVNTQASASSDALKSWKAAKSASAVSGSTAFRASGRLFVMIQTGPSLVVSTTMCAPLSLHRRFVPAADPTGARSGAAKEDS